MIEQKYTVHLPSDHGNVTVHHSLRLLDAPAIDTYQVTSAPNDGGVQLIYGHTFANLANTPPTQQVRRKDRVFLIGSYLPTLATLHMLLFIAPQGSSVDAIEVSPFFRRLAVPFQRFTLIVVTAYSGIPSLPDGMMKHVMTAPKKVQGVAEGPPGPISRGKTGRDANLSAILILSQMHEELFQRTLTFIGLDQIDAIDDEGLRPMLEMALDMGVRPTPPFP